MDLSYKQELKTVSQLNLEEIKYYLREYNKDKFNHVLADYPTRDQEYKDKLFVWLPNNIENVNKNIRKEIFHYLIDNGANVNVQDEFGFTALFISSRKPYKDLVELLLQQGGDVNIPDKYGNTVLLLASVDGDKDMIKIFLQYGADVNVADRNGNTPLSLASQDGNKDIVKLLLQYGEK